MRKALIVVALALAGFAMARIQAVQRIVIIGDSTVCNYKASQYPWAGWGQVIAPFFKDGSIDVINDAIGGRSSRSFIEDGHWATTLAKLQPGDVLLIQFGHNDRDYTKAERYTDTTDYKKYLGQYAREARAKGAHPVFVTPMNMNTWTGSAVREVFTEGANNYRAAMIHAAADSKVPVLDLEKKSKLLMDTCGVTYMAKFNFLGLDTGEYSNYPTGYSDFTHFQEMGALANARMVTEEIKRQPNDSILKLLAPLLATTQAIKVTSSITGDTITKSTRLPKGATVTLKVKTPKGKVFRYWRDEKGDSLSNKKVFTFAQDGLDHSYLALYQGVVVGTEPEARISRSGSWQASRIAGGWMFEAQAGMGDIAIRDASGNQVARLEAAGSRRFLSSSSLPSGVLFASTSRQHGTIRFVNP